MSSDARFVELGASLIEDSLRIIQDKTVGFVSVIDGDSDQDVFSAGSGTLVSIDGVRGILTASHVLTNLPDDGLIGLVCFPANVSAIQRLTFDLGHCRKILIRGCHYGPDGPDLGFLLLPHDVVGSLNARNTFYNLAKRRDAVLANAYAIENSLFDGVAGVVAEWTVDLPPQSPMTRVKGFRAIFGVGGGTITREHNGYDLLELEVTYDGEISPPGSFRGVSGGGLWRFFYCKQSNGEISIKEALLAGVAFHESPLSTNRILTAHGPKSIYARLVDLVVAELQ